jgi:hypothetical protein
MNGSPATAIVRAWVDLYTRGLPEPIRAARRDEVDDDLWCQREEATATGRSARSLATEMLLRLMFGMPSDVSWRLSSGGPASGPSLERHPSIGMSLLGILAIAGALGWGVMIAVMLSVGTDAAWSGPSGPVMVVSVFGASIAFAGATIGLAFSFQDRLSSVGMLVGVLGGTGALFGAIGAYQANGLLILGSGVLAWDLGRSGVIWRVLGLTHAASALAALLLVTGLLTGFIGTSSIGLMFLVPYLASWVAIGVSLIRGAPSLQARTPSVEHRRRDG